MHTIDDLLDAFPTYRFTVAYKRGIKAAQAGKSISACKCRTPESISDWRMGWRDARSIEDSQSIKASNLEES